MEQGYIALLDVLGFSALLSSDGIGRRLETYRKCLADALEEDGFGPRVDYVVFSDSVVLTTGDDENALKVLLRRCSRLFGIMLENEIPIRGAVAHGSYVRESVAQSVFVAGKPIVEAHEFEMAQNWVGIMLAPSVVRRISDLPSRCRLDGVDQFSTTTEIEDLRSRLEWAAYLQRNTRIPFHSSHSLDSSPYDGFAIVPTDGAIEATAIGDSVQRSLLALRRMKSFAPNPSAQEKYRAAEKWLYDINSRWEQSSSVL